MFKRLNTNPLSRKIERVKHKNKNMKKSYFRELEGIGSYKREEDRMKDRE